MRSKNLFRVLIPKKVSQKRNMNINILRKNVASFDTDGLDIDASICSSKFHNVLKKSDIVPVHKKKTKLSKENYRPINILPNISKAYGRCLDEQMSD